MKAFLKRVLYRTMNIAGYELRKIPGPSLKDEAGVPVWFVSEMLGENKIASIPHMMLIANEIQGMISPQTGAYLFNLCYFQMEQGDVVEIGSWQGRSASYFARAVELSRNGVFYAVDHFKGNKGKEQHYVVGENDLSDLRENFLANMARIDLSSSVNLLDMPSYEASSIIKNKTKGIRFLFIDGDHTEEGVKRDLDNFLPMLVDNAIIAFDDFSQAFPGVIKAVSRYIASEQISQAVTYGNTLAIRYKKSNTPC